ncbi:FUSC family protein [Arthrobacter sp. TMS1-12-1]
MVRASKSSALRTTDRRWYQRIGRTLRRVGSSSPALLAGKAGLAAAIAWAIALAVPGAPAQYPYYAPLGALLAMYPTVAGTVKSGLQTVVGLTVGIILAFLALWVGEPNLWTVGFVVGMGVLLAGMLKRTAGGGSGIASAGLFVLIIGNNDLGYSLGYFVQTLIGVSVGMAVSAFIVPPLHLNDALGQIGQLRRTAARHLQDMGEALEEDWNADDRRWAERREDLTQAARNARNAVQYAEESRKANVRRRFHPRDVDQDYQHIRVLETVAFHTLNITNMLQDALHGTSDENPLPPVIRAPMGQPSPRSGKSWSYGPWRKTTTKPSEPLNKHCVLWKPQSMTQPPVKPRSVRPAPCP